MIRLAAGADAAEIRRIYAPAVAESAISFEAEVPTVAELRGRVEDLLARGLPWLVREAGTGLGGYAYATMHRERAAYRWSVEVSVYVAPEARRGGTGRALYTSLFAVLALQGYCNLFAGITLPNAPSVRFHEALGFTRIGVYPQIGYKNDAWHDVAWYGRRIHPDGAPPPPLRSLYQVQQDAGWQTALAAGEALLVR